jgi:hypothetical protein
VRLLVPLLQFVSSKVLVYVTGQVQHLILLLGIEVLDCTFNIRGYCVGQRHAIHIMLRRWCYNTTVGINFDQNEGNINVDHTIKSSRIKLTFQLFLSKDCQVAPILLRFSFSYIQETDVLTQSKQRHLHPHDNALLFFPTMAIDCVCCFRLRGLSGTARYIKCVIHILVEKVLNCHT